MRIFQLPVSADYGSALIFPNALNYDPSPFGAWHGPYTATIKNLGAVTVWYADSSGSPSPNGGYPLDAGKEVTLHMPGGSDGSTLQFVADGSASTLAFRITFNRGES